MEASLYLQSNLGIMHYDEDDELGSMSSFSNDDGDDDGIDEGGCVSSSSSDFIEEASSSSLEGPLFEMSSLKSQLPFKRGLSKYFEGKSQSFTSLSKVKSLEDLAKPERPLMRRRKQQQLKPSKSYGWGLDGHRGKVITKKSSSRGSFSSLGGMIKRSSLLSKHSCLQL